ncbi:MAG: helix-turn-helix domain-containing protein [Candidatus Micrarchaeia archaeon]
MARSRQARRSTRMMSAYGFEYAGIDSVRTCFNMLAEKRGRRLILKFAENINTVTSKEASALNKLKEFLDADALIVASRGGADKLGDDSYFTRKGIMCLSANAFEDYLNYMDIPKAERFFRSRRRIDSSKLRKERNTSGLSIRKLSSITGISKDSLSRYERGDAYVRGATLEKLERFFSTNLSISTRNESVAGSIHTLNRYVNPTERRLDIRAFESFMGDAPPFAALAEKSLRYEIGITNDRRTVRRLAAAYAEISKILHDDRQFIISDIMRGESLYGIPILTRKESKHLNESQLLEVIDSRRD